MKHLIYLVPLVLFCACQNNEDLLGTDNVSDVQTTSVTVDYTLPDGLQSRATSRAYGDGMTVDRIQWAIYKHSESNTPSQDGLIKSGIYTMSADDPGKMDSRFIIEALMVGETYDFVFWAENSQSGYTFDASKGTVSMNYAAKDTWKGATCNDENRDAFFCSVRNVTITKGLNIEAVLYRPFAQLNILTSDLPANDNSTYWVQLGTGTFYNTLNLLDGSATGGSSTGSPTFLAATASDQKMTIKETEYTIISMNYILMDGRQSDTDPTYKDEGNAYRQLYDVQLFRGVDGNTDRPLLGTATSATGEKVGLRNVPFKRNYRTNIYGSLLGSNVSIHYLIQPGFNTPDLTGATATTLDELKALVNAAESGSLITLLSDIELASSWEITRTYADASDRNITIDLNGYDIKGKKPDATQNWGDNTYLIQLNDKNTTLTIKDSSAGNGNLGLGYADYPLTVKNGNLVIEGGDFKGYKGCVKWMKDETRADNESPTVYIKGGVFSAASAGNDGVYRLLDFEEGTSWATNNNICNFVVFGGKFMNYDPSKPTVNGFSTWNFLPRNENGVEAYPAQSVGDQSFDTNYIVEYDSTTGSYTVKKKEESATY